ncbi:MAG: 23S rRNA pseudouridine(1911/1915/1917) synthase RluD [Xanthomonadales bacterium]|nr:23S rRNA pseudouridine(1911/1915/1917) synthase RluD [Xanthomonadales bacterium]
MNPSGTPADDASIEVRELTLAVGSAGLRFDQALAEALPEFSRSRLAAWIKAGDALIEGRTAKPKEPVNGGERVRLTVRLETVEHAAPQDIALDILYQDADLLVVNKPAGLVVHPGAGNPAGTLVNALLHFDERLSALPRAGIIHRLDKETSGALVIARTPQAHAGLVEQLAAREVHRQYECVVYGVLVAGGTVDAPLDRHPVDRLRRAVVEDGKPAITHYRVRQRFRAHTHLQVNLETGRTHQIRVHMAHLRHPLLGDPLYGGGLKLPKAAAPEFVEALRAFKRQALHAERIAFAHPRSGETVDVEAPRPTDLQALLDALAVDLAEASLKR